MVDEKLATFYGLLRQLQCGGCVFVTLGLNDIRNSLLHSIMERSETTPLKLLSVAMVTETDSWPQYLSDKPNLTAFYSEIFFTFIIRKDVYKK